MLAAPAMSPGAPASKATACGGQTTSTLSNLGLTPGKLLEDVGASFNEIPGALDDVYAQTAAQTARILENIGAGATAIADALQNAYNQLAQAAAQILKNLGYGAATIADALENAYGQAAQGASQIPRTSGSVSAR